MAFEQTWRWFGPKDPVTLSEIRQTGATGIVTALHQIPVGLPWTIDKISERTDLLKSQGFSWSVVESLPVHEDIKKRTGDYRQHLDAYKASIRNLGQGGIDTICYNFMPVLDWSRTTVGTAFKDGSKTSTFDLYLFAAFDMFILDRPNASADYPSEVIHQATLTFSSLSRDARKELEQAILMGLPGSGETFSLRQLQAALDTYKDIDAVSLRDNLCSFLREIVPVAEEAGVLLAIHPDDPPWPLLALPRVVSSGNDMEAIVNASDSISNGLTLCTGSLGASAENDLPTLAKQFAHRVNFIHLRNVKRTQYRSFIEDNHLDGDVDMFAVVKEMVLEQQRRLESGRQDARMPFRPDHGHLMFDDQKKEGFYPGYSLYGRAKGLAELRGLELGIRRSLGIS